MLKDLMKRLTDEIDHKVLLPLESAKIHVSEEGDTVRVAVAGKPRYVFPRDDCALLPVPNTTVEMLAQYLAGISTVVLGTGRSAQDRKSTRLNSSHTVISYAVFCLKKKKK